VTSTLASIVCLPFHFLCRPSALSVSFPSIVGEHRQYNHSFVPLSSGFFLFPSGFLRSVHHLVLLRCAPKRSAARTLLSPPPSPSLSPLPRPRGDRLRHAGPSLLPSVSSVRRCLLPHWSSNSRYSTLWASVSTGDSITDSSAFLFAGPLRQGAIGNGRSPGPYDPVRVVRDRLCGATNRRVSFVGAGVRGKHCPNCSCQALSHGQTPES